MRASGDVVCDSSATREQRSAALTALFALIDSDRLKQLWPQQELMTGWADLLCLPSAILQDRAREVQQTTGGDRAKLVVQSTATAFGFVVPTAEVTYIVAGCIANYALLHREAPEIAKRLRASWPVAALARRSDQRVLRPARPRPTPRWRWR